MDKLGTAFENRAIATGFGAHLALPLINEYLDKKPNITVEEAQQLIIRCMQVLFYRDARAHPKVSNCLQFAWHFLVDFLKLCNCKNILSFNISVSNWNCYS